MSVTKLVTRRIAKPWGRCRLAPWFADTAEGADQVGEIWFEDPRGGDPDLLIKYLFTSERLSVQVHPDDAAARAAGYPRGKEEAWLVLGVEPPGEVGLGTTRPLSAEELRAAALDGSIETLMDWKQVKAGDFIYSPAGTVHAIGAGVTLIEVQQNVDVTYRLYDYGRPRELHLDAGIAVADARPFAIIDRSRALGQGRTVLTEAGKFVAERWAPTTDTIYIECSSGRPVWLTVIAGQAGDAAAGNVLMVEGDARLPVAAGTDILAAYPGGAVEPAIVRFG
jgi:mannose-6-phosphate isomerase